MKQEPKSMIQLEAELAAAKLVVKNLKTRIRHEKFATARYDGNIVKWVPDPSLITREDAAVLMKKKNTYGFKQAKLQSIGVPWPPPHGWKRALVKAAMKYYGLATTPEPQPPMVLHGRPKREERDGFRPPIVHRFTRHISKP